MQPRPLKLSFSKIILVMTSLLIVSNCTIVDVAATRALQPDVPALQYELFVQYSELALHEMSEGNPDAAALFNDKARQAARGIVVKPDRPADKVMQESYARLIGLLAEGTDALPPAVVARAQVMYDCWLEEQTQNVDKSEIFACRQAFETVMHIHDSARLQKGQ